MAKEDKETGKEKRLLSFLKPTKERGIEIKQRRAHIIGIFSCKGGVGKTTTLANLGMCLSQMLKGNVLAVDANLSAPNLGLHFGELDPKVTIHDALVGEIPIEKAIVDCHGLDVLFGSIAYGEEVHLVDLRSLLEPLRAKYKIILVDSARDNYSHQPGDTDCG